jgi:hypothetical protein
MKKVYLITHGDRNSGPDPKHTQKGRNQIILLEIPQNIDYVVVGTGTRFQEIYELIQNDTTGARVMHSIFCGSSDGIEPDGMGILDNGRKVDLKTEYIGLISPHFDAWAFVTSFSGNTLLLSGGELMIALGLKDINEKGHLYELDPATKSGKKLS